MILKPMTQMEFTECMKLFVEVYGERTYPQARVKQVWEKFKNTPKPVFQSVLEACVAESFSPPTVSRMLELGAGALAKWRDQRQKSFDEIISKLPYCRICAKQGYVRLVHKKTGYNCMARCHCAVGVELKENLSFVGVLSDEVYEKYSVIEAEPIDWKMISPWPASIEAIMIKIKHNDTDKGFAYGLKFNKLSEEDAWYLYDCYAEEKWQDPKALEILSRSKNSNVVLEITKSLAKQADLRANSRANTKYDQTSIFGTTPTNNNAVEKRKD